MERITTPEMLVAAVTWNAIPVYLDRQRSVTAHKDAQTIVWKWDVIAAMPEATVTALLNSSNATDVMARDIRRGSSDASADDVKLRLARRIMGLRNGPATTIVRETKTIVFPGYTATFAAGAAVDATRIFADALAACVDAQIPIDIARTMITQQLTAAGLTL